MCSSKYTEWTVKKCVRNKCVILLLDWFSLWSVQNMSTVLAEVENSESDDFPIDLIISTPSLSRLFIKVWAPKFR